MRTAAIIGLLLVGMTHGALAGVWECKFTREASPSGLKSTTLELRFLIADDKAEKAYVIGNAGSNPVVAVGAEGGGIQFIERTGSGVLQITAIDRAGNGVHSRHTRGLDGNLIPSQSYGRCEWLP